MKKIKISATRISSFLSCKKKYWFNYIEKMPKLSNPSFKLGLACHESLELAGRIWQEKGKFDDSDKEKIFDMYDKISVREGIEKMEVHAEGKRLVTSRLGSFSLGNKIVSLEETFGFGNSTHSDLTTPLGVPVIGAMDKIVELDRDTLVVVDYKTSKTMPTPEQLKEDLQLSLYDLVASKLYPNYERIVLCLDMLRSDPVYTYRTQKQRDEFDKYLVAVYESMKNLKKKDAKPSLHMFCPWCDFKDYCEAYKKACSQSEYEFLPTPKLSDKAIVDEYAKISSTLKILDSRKRELAMIVIEKIKASGSDVKGHENKLYIRQNARVNYDPKIVYEAVPSKDFATMVNLNKKAVDKYCDENPHVKNKIKKGSITNYTSPFIMSKKINKK